MGKCKACEGNKCGGKYENRLICEDRKNCSCTCQEDNVETFLKGASSLLVGTALFAAGVILTVSTGGFAAIFWGSIATGTGATAAIQPIAKKMTGERMTGKEYAKDLVIGASTGLITGGIGAGGASVTSSVASKFGTDFCRQGLVKMACRSAVGAASGAASGVFQEGATLASDGTFSVGNVLKNTALGAATGGVGHLSGNVVNKVADSGITRSIAKVTVDTIGATVVDAAYQKCDTGEIDGNRLAFNAAARAATSAAFESVKNATYAANGGKDNLILQRQMNHDGVSEDDQNTIRKIKSEIENISPDKIETEMKKAERAGELREELKSLKSEREKIGLDRKQISEEIDKTKKDNSIKDNRSTMRALQVKKDENSTVDNKLRKKIDKISKELGKIPADKIGERNIHVLSKSHKNQIAADLETSSDPKERGLKRVVLDVQKNGNDKLSFNYAGKTDKHDYGSIPDHGKSDRSLIVNLTRLEPLQLPQEKKKKKAEQHKD